MRKLFLLLFFLNSFSQFAQNKIDQSTLDFIKTNEKVYDKIDSFFKETQLDSTAIRVIINESKNKKSLGTELYSKIKLGIILRDKADYKTAIKINNDVLKQSKKIKDRNFEIVCLNMQGVVYRRMDSIQQAINFHQKALELAEKQNPKTETVLRNIAISSNSIGNVYLTLDQLDLAKIKFEKSIEIEKQIGNNLGLAINYQNIGGIYEKKEELDKALENYFLSLQYNLSIKSELGKLICYNSIGQVYLKKKEINKAQFYLQNVVPLALKIQDDFYISNAYLNYGWLLLEQNKISEARTNILKALKIAKSKNLYSIEMECYKILSQTEEKDKNFPLAIEYYKQYHKIKETIISEKNVKYINELNTRYDIQKRQSEVKFLKQENQLVRERLRNSYFNYIFGILLSLLVIGIIYFTHRQKALNSEKQLLLMEQKMLRSQLNPHFIFNALNSIKSYIIKNEKESAVFFLNKFSKLFNVILAGINEKDVTLTEELKIIEIYAMLENMRFENEVDFSINIDKEIDTNMIKVPSLILQPYIENALWHGLNTKKGNKELSINISKQKEKAIISIKDNGIGRKKAQEIKAKKSSIRESIGLKITKERLDSFYGNNYQLSFLDLIENDTAQGTMVILEIPYK